MDVLAAEAREEVLLSAVSARLLPLGPDDFRSEAHLLLDTAEALVQQGQPALAGRLQAAVR